MKGRFWKAAAALGGLCGLSVALFLLGYYSGSTQKVPVAVVAGSDLQFNDSKFVYERKLSVVRAPASLQVGMKELKNLEQVVRFRNERKNLYSSDRFAVGSFWTEDLVIGFADGSDTERPLYQCSGRSLNGLYYNFLSTFQNCWGARPTGRLARFRLVTANPSPLHLPVFSCLTPEASRYLSLNSKCESPEHTVQEQLGFVRAATVLMTAKDSRER